MQYLFPYTFRRTCSTTLKPLPLSLCRHSQQRRPHSNPNSHQRWCRFTFAGWVCHDHYRIEDERLWTYRCAELCGEASGQLYADDGESLLPSLSTLAKFKFDDRKFIVSGQFDYPSEVKISRLRILNVQETPRQVYVDQKLTQSYHYDQSSKVLDVTVGMPLTGGFDYFWGGYTQNISRFQSYSLTFLEVISYRTKLVNRA